MTITATKKQSVISEHRQSESDTGSPQVQIAILTERINQLTQHMRANKQDYASRRGLVKMVSKRNRLLKYLASNDRTAYQSLIKQLGLRK